MLDGTELARKLLGDLEGKLTDAGRVDILGPAVAAPDVSAWWRSPARLNRSTASDHRCDHGRDNPPCGPRSEGL
jgi:hypothetical protein